MAETDLISRQAAIDAVKERVRYTDHDEPVIDWNDFVVALCFLPSAEPEKLTGMIKEMRRQINSGNRGNADYFIVDKIEEIINEYEK